MGIQEPRIQIVCDACEEVVDELDLTMLAGGGWDDRNVKPRLKRTGWTIDGETTVCPDCVSAGRKAKAW